MAIPPSEQWLSMRYIYKSVVKAWYKYKPAQFYQMKMPSQRQWIRKKCNGKSLTGTPERYRATSVTEVCQNECGQCVRRPIRLSVKTFRHDKPDSGRLNSYRCKSPTRNDSNLPSPPPPLSIRLIRKSIWWLKWKEEITRYAKYYKTYIARTEGIYQKTILWEAW